MTEHDVAIVLCDPKYPHNVGGAIRAAAIFCESPWVMWSGDRVKGPADEAGYRLPREERMRAYKHVTFDRGGGPLPSGFTPVCVEFDSTAEQLPDFEHPERPLYVFGPEDGSVPTGYRHSCHRFVRIPGHTCLNLSAAVNVVLYDRMSKLRLTTPQSPTRLPA